MADTTPDRAPGTPARERPTPNADPFGAAAEDRPESGTVGSGALASGGPGARRPDDDPPAPPARGAAPDRPETGTPGGTSVSGTTGAGTGMEKARGADDDPLAPPAPGAAPGPTGTDTPASGMTRTDRAGGTSGTPDTGATGTRLSGGAAPLLPHEETGKLEQRLRHAVAGFVDEPREAVEEADRALEEISARFTDAVTRRRRTLRMSWQEGDDDRPGTKADTEQLRLALRDYRELADRLLHI
ncbi:hypothetical protein [Streptomyces sp. NPDC006739]|uniref:hypothetical protein n=1 Tax=Streptomyces sp. NPDC006739 TaxID=3364763 RepID=UPI0036B75764